MHILIIKCILNIIQYFLVNFGLKITLQAEYVNKIGTDVFFINVNNLILHIIDTGDLPKLQWKIATVS